MEKNQDKGFTLVELLIVIVILGILATVTVFAVRGITDKGQENACSVEARTLDTAIESFYAQEQRDPAYAAGETAAVGFVAGSAPVELIGDYLKDAPDTAKWTFVPAVAASAGPPVVAAAPASFIFVSGGPCDPAA